MSDLATTAASDTVRELFQLPEPDAALQYALSLAGQDG